MHNRPKLRVTALALIAIITMAGITTGVSPSTATTTVVEVDVAGTGIGDTNADILLDGEVVILDHLVDARRHKGVDTLHIETNSRPGEIEIRFDNDGPGNNLFVHGLRVDGGDVPLTEGEIVRTNGTVIAVTNPDEAALWWNASYHLEVEGLSQPQCIGGPLPGYGRANSYFPDDVSFNWGGGQTLDRVCELIADRALTRPLTFDNDGRVVDDTPSDSIVIEVPESTNGSDSVAYIERRFAELGLSMSVDDGQHVTIDLASGEHRFAKKLRLTRGNVTLRGQGSTNPARTLIVHDFDGWDSDHAIEIHTPAITNWRNGFKLGERLTGDDLLSDVTVRDFAVTYALDPGDILDQDVPGGLTVQDLREIGNQNYVPRYAVWDGNGVEDIHTVWQRQAAISLDGLLDANVVNLRGEMVGSHFLGIYESEGLFADELVADGTLNRGAGGNGYALELMQTHDSVIRFDAVVDFRHVSINNVGSNVPIEWSTGNVVAAEYTNTNMDFHKHTEQDNILYAENAVANPFVIPEPVGNPWTWPLYNLTEERHSWGLFEARNASAEDANLWLADNQLAVGELTKWGEPVGGINPVMEGRLLCSPLHNETLRASSNDGLIYGGTKDDTLIGSDAVNSFVFAWDHGVDTIVDFGPEDTIYFQPGAFGLQDLGDVDAALSVDGNDVVIDFSDRAGHAGCYDSAVGGLDWKASIRLVDAAAFFSAAEHVRLDRTFTFYDSVDRDFAGFQP
jgi:hypothetical protein